MVNVELSGRTTFQAVYLVCLVYLVALVERSQKNQIDQTDQINQINQMNQFPATRREMLVRKTGPLFLLNRLSIEHASIRKRHISQ